MGDTGAMALGGAIAAMAIFLKVELLLLLVGGIFVIEALSVMLQVIIVQVLGQTDLPDGADPPPLRDEGVVRDEDHGALLDRHRDPLRRRLRALLQVLPADPRPPVRAARLRARALGPRRQRSGSRAGDEVLVDRSLGNEDDLSLLDGVDVLVKSPGVPGERPLVAGGARARASRCGRRSSSAGACSLPRARASSASPARTARRRRRELLGAIFRAAGRDVAVAGNIGTPLTSVRARRLGRVRALVVPARGRARRSPATSRCCSTSSPTTSTATAASRRTAPRSCASSSARARRSCRAGSGLDGIEFSADDPLPAEPLIRGAHNRENAAAATAAARAAGIDDDAIAEALRTFPGVPHRLELVGERRRRPLRQRLQGDERRRRAARRSPPTRTSRCT